MLHIDCKAATLVDSQTPNIYVKLCRRDLKKDIIVASKQQPRATESERKQKIFINESLTQSRKIILQTLLKIRRSTTGIIKGVTTQEGQVVAFTSRPPQAASATITTQRDLRHVINTKEALQKFCDQYVKKPLEDFVDSWPQDG